MWDWVVQPWYTLWDRVFDDTWYTPGAMVRLDAVSPPCVLGRLICGGIFLLCVWDMIFACTWRITLEETVTKFLRNPIIWALIQIQIINTVLCSCPSSFISILVVQPKQPCCRSSTTTTTTICFIAVLTACHPSWSLSMTQELLTAHITHAQHGTMNELQLELIFDLWSSLLACRPPLCCCMSSFLVVNTQPRTRTPAALPN